MQIWLFDIDGTLVDADGAGKQAMAEAMSAIFGNSRAAAAAAVPFAGRTDLGITQDLFAVHDVVPTQAGVREFHDAYLRQLPAALSRRQGRVLPGVLSWLLSIDEHPAAQLGLLTGNMAIAARHKLQHYGLWDYFPFGGFGDEHSDRNDVAAAALDAAARHVPQPIEECRVFVVGDTPHDVRCARAIQATAIAVATGMHSCDELAASEPDRLLTDLTDRTVLDELLAASTIR